MEQVKRREGNVERLWEEKGRRVQKGGGEWVPFM
jgi:hypothetical protein